jgi:putative transposon-encoded protein
VEIGDGIALEPPSVDLSLPEGLSLPDPERSAGVAPSDEGGPSRANATSEEDFSITEEGAITYIGHGGDVDIPDKVSGITVTAIADRAFNGGDGKYVTKVTLPGTVTRIGDSAFSGCVHLVHIEGTTALTGIGNSAFYGCSKLVAIDLPRTLTRVGGSAFSGCTTLEQISLPDDIENLPDNVFYGCITLSDVKLPAKLTSSTFCCPMKCTVLSTVMRSPQR